MIHSYPSIYALGHAAVSDLFSSPVVIQEKVDGSQFSFGVLGGELQARSKGKMLILDAPEKMFNRAVETIRKLQNDLHPDWVYYGEFLEKPKHNTLTYNRIPFQHIVLFDVMTSDQTFLRPAELETEAHRLRLEVVPCFYEGMLSSREALQELFLKESFLGGPKIEGVVIKNYSLFTSEKKVMMGKYVSEAFKETNEVDWKARNPAAHDVVSDLILSLKTEARYHKAVQHLREQGLLENSPRDIGLLMREVPADILKEEEERIRGILFNHYWKQISRAVTSGVPEWYKNELAKSQFEGEPQDE